MTLDIEAKDLRIARLTSTLSWQQWTAISCPALAAGTFWLPPIPWALAAPVLFAFVMMAWQHPVNRTLLAVISAGLLVAGMATGSHLIAGALIALAVEAGVTSLQTRKSLLAWRAM